MATQTQSTLSVRCFTARVRSRLRVELSEHLQLDEPAALIMEPNPTAFDQARQQLSQADPAMTVAQGCDVQDAMRLSVQEFWLVLIGTGVHNPIAMCRRLRHDHPLAQIVVAASSISELDTGEIHHAGADLVYPRVAELSYLPAIALTTRLNRYARFEHQVRTDLTAEVVTQYGIAAARRQGLRPKVEPILPAKHNRKHMIERALINAEGDHSKAARALEVSRSTLYRWLKEAKA